MLGLYGVNVLGLNFGDDLHLLRETFVLFAIMLALHVDRSTSAAATSSRALNGISVFWHVAGVAVIVGDPDLRPRQPRELRLRSSPSRINNSGFSQGMFWWYVLPLGFLLTQYTITGFDASAHISEETHDAENAAPKGVWRSVFCSAVIGYIVLLAITFAAADPTRSTRAAARSLAVFGARWATAWVKAILIIAVIGQLFCGMSCMTSASRMMYAFSRDGAVPGWRLWSRVNSRARSRSTRSSPSPCSR